MKITKDEARILAYSLSEQKYEINDQSGRLPNLIERLTGLENKLKEFGNDKRRNGRASMDDFLDLLKRFAR